MNFPENVKYAKDHEWIRPEGAEAYVGITDYAQSELGEIVYVDITAEGETIGQNGVFGSIEAVKTVSDLLMPVDGKILEINENLEEHPELINSDPYGEGWIIKISIADPAQQDGLMNAGEYRSFIGK
ncbi:MAG: glycine cleavage system protein GcvH [Dysgonamonadaceae bacterium]|jgi:glycine cleavage system H protein|nr:glycine cleavage system protein GcvH [Dysgonamonadaceae bacterium]